MSDKTAEQFEKVIGLCRDVFIKKQKDYSSAWRVLRTSSLTDQILIKAHRIRNIQKTGKQKVDEGFIPEFIGIVNYAVMALIQLELGDADGADMDQPRPDAGQKPRLWRDLAQNEDFFAG